MSGAATMPAEKSTSELFERNRVILCHFDSYSALLLFARFGRTLLLPGPAHEGAQPAAAPEDMSAYAPEVVIRAVAERFGLEDAALTSMPQFDAWLESRTGPIRVHLLRVKSFAPPQEQVERAGGKWRPVSELRGIAPFELGYARNIFDIIMGGGS